MHHSNKAFTLVEILIVVSIIGILASVILVGMGRFRERGRDARRIADLHQARNALELYYTSTQQYPDVIGWEALSQEIIGAQVGVYALSGDPTPGQIYDYVPGNCSGGKCRNYVLAALLEDPTNPALDSSPKGIIFTMNCDAPVYCVVF